MTPTPRESDELHLALDRGEVRPWYQPIMRLTTGELVGFEALARWHRPSGLVELPGAFIGLAEETGLVTRLDLADPRRRRLRPGPVAGAAAGPPDQRELLRSPPRRGRRGWTSCTRWSPGTPYPPGQRGRRADRVRAAATTCRRRASSSAACASSGTPCGSTTSGPAGRSCTHLVDVPVDGIKIDRFFTERLGGRADAVVQGAARGGRRSRPGHHDRGHRDPEQADRALELGCDLAQGYLWSRAAVRGRRPRRLLAAGHLGARPPGSSPPNRSAARSRW